jgi:hypothetical protein
VNLVCFEATDVTFDDVKEGPKLNAKCGTLLGTYAVLEVVVENLLEPRGRELGSRTLGLRSFDSVADKILEFRWHATRKRGKGRGRLGIWKFRGPKDISETFERWRHDWLVVKSFENVRQDIDVPCKKLMGLLPVTPGGPKEGRRP